MLFFNSRYDTCLAEILPIRRKTPKLISVKRISATSLTQGFHRRSAEENKAIGITVIVLSPQRGFDGT